MFNFDVEEVKAAARGNKAFTTLARFWTGTTVFQMGDEIYVLAMRDGEIEDFRRADQAPQADITIIGSASSWGKLLEKIPPQGYQDPFFFSGGAGFEVQGDMVANVGPYYLVVQEFVGIMRAVRSGPPAEATLPRVEKDFDDAVGRYMYIDVQGVQYRVYYEEAGQGDIPLLLQHTAGADSRQWRNILEDPDYQKKYRIICYDLPYHGRSLPPTSVKWWEERYKLTRSFLMDTVIAISRRLELHKPVYMGCSVGGLLAPDLAYYHPEEFRAVIALNGALGWPEEFPRPTAFWETWSNPRVGPQWTMALIRSNMSPVSNEAYQREIMWVYSQCAPSINEGDINYFAWDHDLTAEQAAQIDTSKLPVYLLTGEYDGNATGGTQELADAISGSHMEITPRLGHFGPAENPELLKTALLPVLEEIAARSTVTT